MTKSHSLEKSIVLGSIKINFSLLLVYLENLTRNLNFMVTGYKINRCDLKRTAAPISLFHPPFSNKGNLLTQGPAFSKAPASS